MFRHADLDLRQRLRWRGGRIGEGTGWGVMQCIASRERRTVCFDELLLMFDFLLWGWGVAASVRASPARLTFFIFRHYSYLMWNVIPPPPPAPRRRPCPATAQSRYLLLSRFHPGRPRLALFLVAVIGGHKACVSDGPSLRHHRPSERKYYRGAVW